MPASTDPREILNHIKRVRRDDILRPAGDRLLNAFGRANDARSLERRMERGRVVIAFAAGVFVGLVLVLLLGDVPARTAATVLQAQEEAKW